MLRPPLPFTAGRRPPARFSPRRPFCMGSKVSEAASPAVPRFVRIGGKEGLSEDAFGRGFKFRLVSYNILAQAYVKSSYFPHSPSPCLRWKARSQAILTLLRSFEADLLCLQELDEFDSFYRKNMQSLGYSSIYIQRSGLKRDGCGIFYKPTSAELVLKEVIEYNDLVDFVDPKNSDEEDRREDGEILAEERSGDGNGRDPSDPRVRLKRDCVGIMAAFRLNDPSRHLVVVANTHIYWDPDWADVKLAQAEYLLSRLSRFKNSVCTEFCSAPSIIVAGDFNSTPGDAVYRFMVSEDVVTAAAATTKPPVPLRSLYASAGGEPPFTNCTPGFTGTLDYIFFSGSGRLRPIGLLQVPGPESPDVTGGLPNHRHPSDHLPIGGNFMLVDL
ncbi:unnamed protein product [Spirodela intermedia]|uniref:Endonuclease/exonuclease/phosphatase domain-containing protein n=1 Tax=Spirodela intermedia TaxID=51605 RepID=A0A7I8LP45_SPIIN|nr:unnamed protein product [Spirodela intermedia]